MTKEEKIIAAVTAYNTSVAISEILKRYHCSKGWLYKWINRYKLNPQGDWYRELSRRPKTIHLKITDQQKTSVIDARKALESNPYSQRGAISIQYTLQQKGEVVLPVWKINRILSKAHLSCKPAKTIKQQNEYPFIGICLDQMDFIGPRFLKGDGRYYSLNIIDTTTHYVQVNPLRSHNTEDVLNTIIRYWKHRGMPDFVQMDNALSFRGSNRHPHSFGRLIRLALHFGITVVFIPVKEPWRNGIIEKFNDTFDKRFVRARAYTGFEHLEQCAKEFESFHNQNHRYGIHKNKTPLEQMDIELMRDKLAEDFILPDFVPLQTGRVMLVRFIRSNLVLDVFGEKFLIPKHLEYNYVVAVIDVERNLLYVLQDGRIEWQTHYEINV